MSTDALAQCFTVINNFPGAQLGAIVAFGLIWLFGFLGGRAWYKADGLKQP